MKSKVEKLCQSFENDECNVDLSDHHPNVIANVLKLYLRQVKLRFFLRFISAKVHRKRQKSPEMG